MTKVFASIVGIAILLATTVAGSAQRVTPAAPSPTPAASQTLQAPYRPGNPNPGPDQSRPLFWIGQLPAVVWAPVQPPYSSRMNGTQAANALQWNEAAF